MRAVTDRPQALVDRRHPCQPLLIVNADDYGLTIGVSEGILRAHETGIITSTSILVLGRAFATAAPRLADSALGIGVHLAAVGEDRPLLAPRDIPSLVDAQGRLCSSWRCFVARAALGMIDVCDLEREFRAQLEAVIALGLEITHIDTHQHLHLWPLVGRVVARLAAEYRIPAIRVPRSASMFNGVAIGLLANRLAETAAAEGLAHPAWAAGLDQAGRLHGRRLQETITALAAKGCDAELSCHPGDARDTHLYQWGYSWREEMDAFRSISARVWVEEAGFRLGTYRDLNINKW